MNKPRIENAMTLSTGHIKQADAEWLKACAEQPYLACVVVDVTPYGFLIYVDDCADDYEKAPTAIRKILEYAKDNGVSYVLLDRNEDECDEFPTYVW